MAVKQQTCCDLCGGTDNLIIPWVAIAFGFSGDDYAFCQPCLSGMTAEQFFEKVVVMNGLLWPPTYK